MDDPKNPPADESPTAEIPKNPKIPKIPKDDNEE